MWLIAINRCPALIIILYNFISENYCNQVYYYDLNKDKSTIHYNNNKQKLAHTYTGVKMY